MPSFTADALARRHAMPWLPERDRKLDALINEAVLILFGLGKPARRHQRNEMARRCRHRAAMVELSRHPVRVPPRHFDDVQREDVAAARSTRLQHLAFTHAMQRAGYRK